MRGIPRPTSAPNSRHPRAPITSPGFTLIELLVVISVITLMMAVLLPALSSARNAAKTSVCKSNLRQAGVGIFSYAGQNKETLVPGLTTWDAPFGVGIMYWFQRLMVEGAATGATSRSRNSVVCPADLDPWIPYTLPGEEEIYNSSYGANPFAHIVDADRNGTHDWGATDPTYTTYSNPRLDRLAMPSEIVLVAEVRNSFFFDPWLPNSDQAGYDGEWDWGRHQNYDGFTGGRVNMLHGDGHVSETPINGSMHGLAVTEDQTSGARRVIPKGKF